MKIRLFSSAAATASLLCLPFVASGLTIEENFSYDANGRLTGVEVVGRPDLSQQYAYDASGNLTQKSIGGSTVSMTYDKANQLVSRQDGSGTTYYDYDKAGRMVRERRGSEVLAKYEYGYLDKVVAVERGGQRTEFYYNAKGMLVGKKLPSGEIEPWAWSGRALIMRGDTVYVNEDHISGGVPVASRRMGSDKTTFYENDYLGNTTAVRSDGELQPVFSTPFGDGMGQDVADRRFTGKPYDADLNAYVFPFRNYSVATSRWMSADPAGFPDGPNRHFYAPVPTMGLDPWGLSAWAWWDFVWHYYTGGGSAVNLTDIGLLDGVKSAFIADGAKDRLNDQILGKAQSVAPQIGDFVYTSSRPYDFHSVSYALGDATVSTRYNGELKQGQEYEDGTSDYYYNGTSRLSFSDIFTDPLSIIEMIYGSSTHPDVPAWLATVSAVGGTSFAISGQWDWSFSGAFEL